MTSRRPWIRSATGLTAVLLAGGLTLTGCNLAGAEQDEDGTSEQREDQRNDNDDRNGDDEREDEDDD